MKLKLDSKTVASLTLGDVRDQIFWDDELKCFGLRLRKTDDGKLSRSWVVQYRSNGQTRRHKVGDADVLGADQARKAAKNTLAKVQLGSDPQADRADRRKKDERKFKVIADEYLNDREAEVRPKTHRQNVRYLSDSAYFGSLHAKPIDRIELHEIAECLRAIKHDCGGVTTNRARSAIAALFRWAMRNGYLKSNPTIDVIKYDETARSRVLSNTPQPVTMPSTRSCDC
jgi:hypothetical protein